MYEKSFGLKARPFLAAPREDRCHSNRLMDCARQTLSRSIERGEGPGLLIGPPGTGKTLLCQRLAHEFSERFTVVQLASGRLGTRTALLQAILYELGLPYRGMDEGELRLALIDFLEPREDSPGGLLLLVDEAQALPLRLLEEIRLITNLVRDGQPRVRVVLAGTPELEERFASPKLGTFAQRLAARCYLDSLDYQETTAYVRAEIAAVGGDPSRLFNEDTLRSIYRASDGIPRLINQVCDHAFLLASLGGQTSLSSDAIEEAWADLQQLPTPWTSGSPAGAPAGVIEFGTLDDVDDAPEAIPFRNEQQPQLPLHLATTEQLAENDLQSIGCRAKAPGLTEVDLDFPEFGDPHNEQFEEEEVVLDRYPNDVELFAGAPRVSSWESRQLATILGNLPSTRVVMSRPETEATLSFSPVVDNAAARTPIAEIRSLLTGDTRFESPAAEIVMPASSSDIYSTETPGAIDCLELVGAREATFWAGAKACGDEPQLIVLEDDSPEPRRQPPRRRPYRQLFAKLRRG
jgi:type II secretory pathway predicted ATPase ExeA